MLLDEELELGDERRVPLPRREPGLHPLLYGLSA